MANRFASHHALQAHYEAKFDQDVAQGKYLPATLQLGLLPWLITLAYFLIPHKQYPWVYRARHLVFGIICSIFAYTCINFRAKKVAVAFGVGLMSAWGIMWFATMILCHNPQEDFKRMEYGEKRKIQSAEPQLGGDRDLTAEDKRSAHMEANGANGFKHSSKENLDIAPPNPDIEQYHYRWQPFPEASFSKRLLWVVDLLLNFRGLGWNWHIHGPPPPPPKVVAELKYYTPAQRARVPDSSTGKDGTHRYLTRRSLFKHALTTLAKGYLKLDFLKLLVVSDPYFWGYVDSPAPGFLPGIIRSSPVIVRAYRSLLTMYAVKTALVTIFSLSPLFFCILLGPSVLGPHAEPWMYPDAWGSYSNVLNKGLAGWWGGWWHQTFRFAFAAPSEAIIRKFEIDPRGFGAKTLRVFIAFGLSGLMHAAGSYTQPGNTRPLLGPMRFFLLQPIGIGLEMGIKALCKRSGIEERTPAVVKKVSNLVWVHAWLYLTAPLLCDDFARGGIWLFEPIGLSPLRALGFGTKEDSWWTWGPPEKWFFWHEGKSWWTTGIHM